MGWLLMSVSLLAEAWAADPMANSWPNPWRKPWPTLGPTHATAASRFCNHITVATEYVASLSAAQVKSSSSDITLCSTTATGSDCVMLCSDQSEGAQSLIKGIAQSADAGPGGWVGLKRKLLHLDVDGSGAVNADGETSPSCCKHLLCTAVMYRQ